MKKILFLMRYPIDQTHHLKQKFDGQMNACVKLGYHVYHFGYDKKGEYLIDVNRERKMLICRTHFSGNSHYRSTFGFFDLFHALHICSRRLIFDYIYMRSKPVDQLCVSAIKRFSECGTRIIVEIPSYQSNEAPLNTFRSVAQRILGYYGRKLHKQVTMYTLIGPDAGGTYCGKPAINIENGINVDTIPMRRYCPQEAIHILALASMRKWHAYDRLIRGLAEYDGDENIVIDMVGGDSDGSLTEWLQLAEDLNVLDSIVVHGPLFGDDLTKMFESADVGVSTLGLHRNNLSSGAVLKSREYMARGLPFIYGYADPALSEDAPYAVRFPADDEPVDMEKVIRLARKAREDEMASAKMREYARNNMSWEMIFQKIFDSVDKL